MKGFVKSVFFLLIAFSVLSGACLAQGTSNQNPNNQNPVATTTEDLSSMSSTRAKSQNEKANESASGYTQDEDTNSLEKAVSTFNEQYCPPEPPIRQIDQEALLRLIKAELIMRADMKKYEKMVLVDGKVFKKEEKKEEEPRIEPKPQPSRATSKNLFGAIETAGDEIEQDKTRGQTEGNKKPEQVLKLKRRKIVYRDKYNQLKEMEIHSPPKFPAKKKQVVGKRGRKIKDFATTIMVPKDNDGEKSDLSAFDEMPSADAWIEEGNSQGSGK